MWSSIIPFPGLIDCRVVSQLTDLTVCMRVWPELEPKSRIDLTCTSPRKDARVVCALEDEEEDALRTAG